MTARPHTDALLRLADAVDAMSIADATADQLRLAPNVVDGGGPRGVRLVAGCDCAFEGDAIVGAIVVHAWPSLEVVDRVRCRRPIRMPYVPGFLSYRELPVLLQATALLAELPDLLIVDGCGRLHPRRFGLACHLGLVLDLPAIGNAKSLLCGNHRTLRPNRGARATIKHRGEIIGAALRTRDDVKPVYASVGHRLSLDAACRWIFATADRFRLPEPIRTADHLSKNKDVVAFP